jgi:hypothetical protein
MSFACRARFLASPWTGRSRASLGMTTFTNVFQHPARILSQKLADKVFPFQVAVP